MKINSVFDRTNWKLLSEQKMELMLVEKDWADGLLNFIDSIQDVASTMGYPVVWLDEEYPEDPQE